MAVSSLKKGKPISLAFLTGLVVILSTCAEQEPPRVLVGWGEFAPLPEHRVVRLLLGGDVMLARKVGAECERRGDQAWPFREIAELTNAADLFCCNLESLFSEHPLSRPPHLLFQLPAERLTALTTAGVDAVCLANNHTGNVGAAGVVFSRELLEGAGIACAGAGQNLAEAHRPAQFEQGGLRIALLAYTALASLTAGPDSPGHTAWGYDVLKRDIAALPADIDLLIVSQHAGVEYNPGSTAQQRAFAQRAVELGADIVLGHHPHVLEPVEIVQGAVVCHSLGNLVMDQPWNPDTEYGALIELRCRDGGVRRLVVHPLHLSADYQPLPADADQTAEVLRRLGLNEASLVVD